MTTHDDKFHIHPGLPDGHDWDEFIEALEEFGLEKRTTPDGSWLQFLHPRTTLWRSKDGGPFNIITIELTLIGVGGFSGRMKTAADSAKQSAELAVAPWW